MTKKEFITYTNNIENKLSILAKYLKMDKIDYTFLNIDKVEDFYRNVIKGNFLIDIPLNELELIIYGYIGEAIKYYVGGNWAIGTAKKDSSYGTPIILNWANNPKNMRISPYVWCERIKNGTLERHISELVKSIIRQSNEQKKQRNK